MTSKDLRNQAISLAQAHISEDPLTERVFFFRDDKETEIRLLEITTDIPETGEIIPVSFLPSVQDCISFRSVVILLTPKEWKSVETGQLLLPPDWDKEHCEEFQNLRKTAHAS